MTVPDVLALVKGHLLGDDVATGQLADAFRDAGDEEGAKTVVNGVFWLDFQSEEALGKVGVRRGAYGPDLYLEDYDRDATACFDLYNNAQENGSGTISLLVYAPKLDEPVVKIPVYDEGNLHVVVNRELDYAVRHHNQGIHSDWDHVFIPRTQPDEDLDSGL